MASRRHLLLLICLVANHHFMGVGGLTDLTSSFGSIISGGNSPGKMSRSSSSSIRVGEPPQWRVEPDSVVTFSNSTGVQLDCQASGDPAPTVQWYQEGDQLITHNLHGLRLVMPNGSLVFPPFSSQHFRRDVHLATYHCLAKNRLGAIVSRPVKVQAVLDLDYEVVVPDVSVMEGNTAIMRCQLEPPEVRPFVTVTSWLHEEGTAIEVTAEKEPRGKYSLLQSGHLLIHHTSTYDTYKTYVCKTQHILTHIRRRNIRPARITLTEPSSNVVPRLVEPDAQHHKIIRNFVSGEHVLMPCVSHGNPVPESTWFRMDGVGLRQVLPSQRFKFHLEVLAIVDLQVDDSGIYICIMNNTVGAERIEVNLTVRSPLTARIDPISQTVDLNHPAAFRCSYSGWPVDRVHWYKNGQLLTNGQRYYSSSSNGTLKFYTVQEGDEGVYQCIVSNEYDLAHASGYLWLGDSKPSLLYRFSDQTLQPGPSVSLKCIAKANPPPSITWQLDGFPLPHTDRYLVGQYVTVHDDVISHVNISKVEARDGGSYACIASNQVGEASHQARLNVYGPPHVRSVPLIKAIEGQPFFIQCPASGYPIERLVWKKDGLELPQDPRQNLFPNGTLMIQGIQKQSDEGYYSCSAFNDRHESHTGSIQIQILTAPTIMPFLFPNKLLSEGMRSAVSCQILEGSLPIVFRWTKNGQALDEPGLVSTPGANLVSNLFFGSLDSSVYTHGIIIRQNDEYSSTLVIEKLEFGHRGNYTCSATNSAGSASHSAELIVNVPPKWIIEPHDVQGIVGESIILPCLVEGYPDPTTVWTKANEFGILNYQVLPLGTNYNQFSNGSLMISSLDKMAQGTYTCTAQNGIRTAITKSVNVSVNVPPQFQESTIHVSVRKGDRAILVCEANGDLPMEVFWRKNGIPVSERDDPRYSVMDQSLLEEGVSRFGISSVTDQDEGQMTCEAVNRFGRDQKHFILSIEDVPSAPVSLRLSGIKSRSLEISWSGPHDGNSPILNYVVEYTNIPDRRDASERQTRKMTASGEATTLLVKSLRPGTLYKFHVVAENKHGSSAESQAVTTRMLEEAPSGQARNLEVISKTSTELEIAWEAPPILHWNSERLSYRVGFREVGDSSSFEYKESGSSSQEMLNSLLLTSLKKFTPYQIVVQPYNREGLGPASNPIVATTMEDVPTGPPENVHCQSRSSTSILVEWSKPKREHRNGIIRGYWLQFYPRVLWYAESKGQLMTRETESEMLEINHLDVFTNYSIRVAAFTKAGRAIVSAQVFCRTSEDAPSAPMEIKAATSGLSSVIVSWRSPAHPNGLIRKYTVYRTEILNNKEVDSRQSSVLSGPNYVELTGLLSNRRYDLRVRAETSKGYGDPSEAISIMVSRYVGAQIVSFGEVLAVPWKSVLVLDCLHVGQPSPLVQWLHKMKSLQENSKYQIFPNGSLSIQHVTEADEGDYSCSVQNVHASDQIVYEVIVQIPPMAPVVALSNATHKSLQVTWHGRRSRKQPILGYTLYYRREHGLWQKSDVDPLIDKFWLHHLQCGANYSVYLEAYSHTGPGSASEVLKTRTEGRVPDVPNPSTLLSVNKTFVTVHLESFGNGGCAILYFVIEYRRDIVPKYVMVANNIAPRERDYTIRGLDPATRYFIKVTAHNTAGSSVAEYPFATLTSLGVTVPPPIRTPREQSATSSGALILSVKILSVLFLSVCIIISAVYIAVFIRKWKRKRELTQRDYSGSSSYETQPLRTQGPSSGAGRSKLKLRSDMSPILPPFKSSDPLCTATAASGSGRGSFESQDWSKDICPYATFQLGRNQPHQFMLPFQEQQTHQMIVNDVDVGKFHSGAGNAMGVLLPFTKENRTFLFTPNQPSSSFKILAAPSRNEPMYAQLNKGQASSGHDSTTTDSDVKKLLASSSLPIAQGITAEAIESKYDTDSDMDYRQRPARVGRPKPRRASRGRRASHSSSSSDSISPMQRVRSIEEMDFPNPGLIKLRQAPHHFRPFRYHPPPLQLHNQHETNFIFGSGSILPPSLFSDAQLVMPASSAAQPEVLTLGRKPTSSFKKKHSQHQFNV